MYINSIYALDESKYNVKNAVCWGLCKEHLKEARVGSLGYRAVQLLIGFAQLPPVSGQMVSLFELAIINRQKKSNDPEKS